MGVAASLLFFCATYSDSHGRVRSVPTEYSSVRQAVTNAQNGDTVLVASGVYSGYYNRDIEITDKQILVMSEDGPQSTIIDCGGLPSHNHRAFMFDGSVPFSPEIRGFTFWNGYHESGGAVTVSNAASPLFRNCIFTGNTAAHNGGAAFVRNASARFIDCTFSENHGQGLASGGGAAGAVEVYGGNATFGNCDFEANTSAREHGAVNALGSSIQMTNCRIIDNEGYGDYGPNDWNIGAVALGEESDAVISGCVFAESRGYGLGVSMSQAAISGCTFAYNCGGIYAWLSDLTIDHTIIAFSTSHESITLAGRNTTEISCTDIFGNAGGDWAGGIWKQETKSGNISADPRFCNSEDGDLHIYNYSPCAPDYAPCSELIGACDVSCESDWVCGDLDFSGIIDIDDIVYIMNYVFNGGAPPIPYEAGNVDCAGYIDIDDTVYLLQYVFQFGTEPCAGCR